MTIVSSAIEAALTLALRNEIQNFRDNVPEDIKKRITEELFDPLHSETCLLGLSGMQNTMMHHSHYRNDVVGAVPSEYKLGRFGSGMTPFEIWSAYHWDRGNKEYVLKVLRCMKNESDDCPEVWFKED